MMQVNSTSNYIYFLPIIKLKFFFNFFVTEWMVFYSEKKGISINYNNAERRLLQRSKNKTIRIVLPPLLPSFLEIFEISFFEI